MVVVAQAISRAAVRCHLLFVVFLYLALFAAPHRALEVHFPLSMEAVVVSGIAAFGPPFTTTRAFQRGELIAAVPFDACGEFQNAEQLAGRIVMVVRGGCSFAKKAFAVQNASGIGVLVRNSDRGKSKEEEKQMLFMMSDDGSGHRVRIPVEMITASDGDDLLNAKAKYGRVVVSLGRRLLLKDYYAL